MSDEGTMELTVEDKMAATYAAIMKIIILCIIGWAVFVFAFLNITHSGGGFYYLPLFGGMIIAAFPMLRRILSGGIGAMFATPDNTKYYNVYASGRRERDYSTEATMGMLGLFLKFIGLLIVIFIGIVATVIHLLILLGKYIYYYRLANPKPPFVKSAFAIYVAGLAALIIVPLIMSTIFNIKLSVENAQWEKEVKGKISSLPAFPFEAEFVPHEPKSMARYIITYPGQYDENAEYHLNYNYKEKVEIPKGVIFTVKGVRKEGDFNVEYEGQQLRVQRNDIMNIKPVK